MSPQKRRKARKLVIQALYQNQMASHSLNELIAQYMADNDPKSYDPSFFKEALSHILRNEADYNNTILPLLDRPADQITPIENAILKLGTFELKERIDVPYKVVINEAIEMTKDFGATDDAHKYVNGILDKVGAQIDTRKAEMKK